MKIIHVLLFFLLFIPALSFGQERSKALPGEGVNAFLLRNNRSIKKYYQPFIELNKGKFGKDNALLEGVSYILPSDSIAGPLLSTSDESGESDTGKSKEKKREPLFGEKYAEYTVDSDRLKGACFYLVSGHGGPDPGAVGRLNGKDLCEDEYAYDIVLRLARALMTEGATVHIIIQDAKDGIRDDRFLEGSKRETCMGDVIPINQKKRLQQRCDKINELDRKAKEKYRRAFFIHLDSRSEKEQIDVFFYYWEGSKEGRKAANTLRETFQNHYDKHQPSRGFRGTVSTRDLHVLGNTDPVAVFTELGNIKNTFDQRRFLEVSNRQALANWICRGFIKDYEDFKKNNKK